MSGEYLGAREHRGEPQRIKFTRVEGGSYYAKQIPMSLDSPQYTEFKSLRDRERLYRAAKGLTTFVHDNEITSIVYPDLSARTIRSGISMMWKEMYPGEKEPNPFFVNPQALLTRRDVSNNIRATWEVSTRDKPLPASFAQEEIENMNASEILRTIGAGFNAARVLGYSVTAEEVFQISMYRTDAAVALLHGFIQRNGMPPNYASGLAESGILEAIIKLAKRSERFSRALVTSRPKEKILDEFKRGYPGLMENADGKIAVIDTCLHEGRVMSPLVDRLFELGFSDIQVAVVDSTKNTSAIVPDLTIFSTDAGCYPFGKEDVAKKEAGVIIPSTIFVGKSHEDILADAEIQQEVQKGRRIRAEIGQIVKENRLEFSIESDSLVVERLQARRAAGKNLDVLSLDQDGTIYIRGTHGEIYTGENQTTAQQIREKGLPVIINTARPEWENENDFTITDKLGLPLPEVVIAADGTQVKWRGKDRRLHDDAEYTNMMGEHKVIVHDENGDKSRQFDSELVYMALDPLIQQLIPDRNFIRIINDEARWKSFGAKGLPFLRLVMKDLSYQTLQEFNTRMDEYISGVEMHLSEITSESTDDLFTGWLHIVPSIGGKDRALHYVLSKLSSVMGEEVTAHVAGDTSVDLTALTMEGLPGKYNISSYAVSNLPPYTRKQLEGTNVVILDQPGPDGVFQIVNNLE